MFMLCVVYVLLCLCSVMLVLCLCKNFENIFWCDLGRNKEYAICQHSRKALCLCSVMFIFSYAYVLLCLCFIVFMFCHVCTLLCLCIVVFMFCYVVVLFVCLCTEPRKHFFLASSKGIKSRLYANILENGKHKKIIALRK